MPSLKPTYSHHRDTENTEIHSGNRVLRALRVSVVNMRLRWFVLLLVLTTIGMGVAFSSRAATAIAEWLVVQDPLGPAPAIVVLNGYFPFRAVEAASLYQQGWAKEV